MQTERGVKMNIDSFLDEYKFISDFYKVIYSPKYVSLSKDEKKEVLIRLIEINTQRKNSDIIKRLEGNLELSISSKYEEKEVLKDIARPKRVKQRKFEDVNINPILECSSIEQMLSLGLIPKKENEESLKKIQKILLTIVREIEEYKLLQVEEESDFFDEEIEKLENIFEIISDYAFYEENVEIETQSDFSVVYDMSRLNNLSYWTYSYGDNALTSMENRLKADGKKALIVKDSFALTAMPFLILGMEKIQGIDLRYFTGSLLSYIKSEQPDTVIVLYNIENLTAENKNNSHTAFFDFR